MDNKDRKEFDEWFGCYLYCDYSEELVYQAWLAGKIYMKDSVEKLEDGNYELRQELILFC